MIMYTVLDVVPTEPNLAWESHAVRSTKRKGSKDPGTKGRKAARHGKLRIILSFVQRDKLDIQCRNANRVM